MARVGFRPLLLYACYPRRVDGYAGRDRIVWSALPGPPCTKARNFTEVQKGIRSLSSLNRHAHLPFVGAPLTAVFRLHCFGLPCLGYDLLATAKQVILTAARRTGLGGDAVRFHG